MSVSLLTSSARWRSCHSARKLLPPDGQADHDAGPCPIRDARNEIEHTAIVETRT